MRTLRMLVAVGCIAATLATGAMTGVAQAANGAADKTTATDAAPAKKPKPVSYPAPLILCRPYQTCPP